MLSRYQLMIADFYKILVGNTKKLVPRFFDKEKLALNYKKFQLYLRPGLKLKKIHRTLELSQSQWLKPHLNIRNSASLNAFKKKLLNFIRPCSNSIFDIHKPLGIKLLTRLHLGLIPLHEHKFRHCFQDTLNPLCECAKDIESTMPFFLHCTNFLIPRQTLFQNNNISSQSETQLSQTLLYGNQNYHPSINSLIINSTIEYIISTERFKCPLFD